MRRLSKTISRLIWSLVVYLTSIDQETRWNESTTPADYWETSCSKERQIRWILVKTSLLNGPKIPRSAHIMHNQTSGSPCPPTSKNPRRLYRPYKYGRIASNASHSLPTVRSNSHAAADVTTTRSDPWNPHSLIPQIVPAFVPQNKENYREENTDMKATFKTWNPHHLKILLLNTETDRKPNEPHTMLTLNHNKNKPLR